MCVCLSRAALSVDITVILISSTCLRTYLHTYIHSDGEREKRIVSTLTDKGKQLALEETGADGKAQTTIFQPDEVAVAWLLHHPSNIVSLLAIPVDR